MADISNSVESPPKKKSRVSKYPHGSPRSPEKLKEIWRLRNTENMQWRDIGPKVGMTGQGACLLYHQWHSRGWFEPLEEQEITNDPIGVCEPGAQTN